MKTGGTHLFLAVPIPAEIRASIHELRGQLVHADSLFKKLVHPEDYHITLKFLGGVQEELAAQVKAAAEQAAARHQPFTLQVRGLGVFGSPASPRIVWLGIDGDMAALSKLQADVEGAMVPLGFERENRPYRPHITLAKRYTGASPFELNEAKRMIDQQTMPLTWRVDRMTLYRTHLGALPMYEPAAELALATSDSAASS